VCPLYPSPPEEDLSGDRAHYERFTAAIRPVPRRTPRLKVITPLAMKYDEGLSHPPTRSLVGSPPILAPTPVSDKTHPPHFFGCPSSVSPTIQSRSFSFLGFPESFIFSPGQPLSPIRELLSHLVSPQAQFFRFSFLSDYLLPHPRPGHPTALQRVNAAVFRAGLI